MMAEDLKQMITEDNDTSKETLKNSLKKSRRSLKSLRIST
jgi:hypothetical protein